MVKQNKIVNDAIVMADEKREGVWVDQTQPFPAFFT